MVRRLNDTEMDRLNIKEWIGTLSWSLEKNKKMKTEFEEKLESVKDKDPVCYRNYIIFLKTSIEDLDYFIRMDEAELREYEEAYKEYASEE